MRCVCTIVLLALAGFGISAETLPGWFIPLREAVYEQNLKADEILPLYRETLEKARANCSGAARYVLLARCEYMMGRAYQYEERKKEAAARFSEGMNWAEKAIKEAPSNQIAAEAWQMRAENLSQSCAVRSTAYAMANGLDVAKYAEKALELNRRNAAAQFLIAARWVYAPSPFNNYRRGIEMMTAILAEADPEKDDFFNVYSAIGYTYVQQKKYADARPWFLKSLEVYPTNKYIQGLLSTCLETR